MPDAGFADLTINVEGVRRMRDAVTIPIAADADTGYGGAANSYYTALQLARNGADALSIEDQKEPKLCPLLSASPPEVVSLSEAVSRVEAAVAAKRVADICVVARTDARGEAVWPRLEAFASAGAEALYLSVGAFETKAEWKDVISNAPLPMTLTYDSRLAAMFAVNELEDLGCKLLDFPLTPLFAAMKGMRTSLANVMKQKERLADGSELTIEDFKTVISAEKHLLPTLKRG